MDARSALLRRKHLSEWIAAPGESRGHILDLERLALSLFWVSSAHRQKITVTQKA